MPTKESKNSQLPISRSSFKKDLDRADRAVNKKVGAYIEEPNERNVHDLRTATRRLLAGVELLPKKIRNSRKVARYESDLRELMKLNAKTRDLDLVISKINETSGTEDHIQLLASLEQLRKSSVVPGRSFARSLKSKLSLPVDLKEVSGSDLKKRFEKVSQKYLSKVNERLPAVLSKPDEKKELHLLREDVRTLRYVLSLGEGRSLASVLKVLRSWQSVLGDVHDSDIFVQYMAEQTKFDDTGSLLEDEIAVRNRNYDKFKTLAEHQLKLPD